MVFSVVDSEGHYQYLSDITVIENSTKMYISYFMLYE